MVHISLFGMKKKIIPPISAVSPVQPCGQPGFVLSPQYIPLTVCSAALVLPVVCHDPELSVALTPGSDTTTQNKVKT